jgi:anti-sigma B factor antagonist
MGKRDEPPGRRAQAAQDGAGLLTSVRMAGSARCRYVLVSLFGQADLTHSGPLREILDSQIARQPRVLVIDLGELEFMDSSVLFVLLRAWQAMDRHGGLLALAHPREPVARVLRLTGVDQIVPVYDNVTEAAGERPS